MYKILVITTTYWLQYSLVLPVRSLSWSVSILHAVIGLHFDIFLGFLGFLLLWSCYHFDKQEQLSCKSLWMPFYIKWFYEFRMSFVIALYFTFYKIMDFISNSITAQWIYSVGLVLALKKNFFNWDFMYINVDLCASNFDHFHLIKPICDIFRVEPAFDT